MVNKIQRRTIKLNHPEGMDRNYLYWVHCYGNVPYYDYRGKTVDQIRYHYGEQHAQLVHELAAMGIDLTLKEIVTQEPEKAACIDIQLAMHEDDEGITNMTLLFMHNENTAADAPRVAGKYRFNLNQAPPQMHQKIIDSMIRMVVDGEPLKIY